MREHQVPQDITGYNFHIIGEMTIKQFAEVAVGVVIAVIIYTTNLPMEDISEGKAWVAFLYEGEDIEPEHGGPVRLLVPHLYFWKSAKWLKKLEFVDGDIPGFWEVRGYHNYGDPWKEQRYDFD